ncbi:hypothetical protein ACHWQZ_G013647 [Mnemiopsis leidyi]
MSWRFSLVLAVLLICSGDGQKLRIYNGERALEGEFPFISLILASSSFSSDGSGATGQNMCGGSILSDRIILTAAHCVVRDTAVTDPATSATVDELYNPRNLEVNVGALDITQYEATAKMISPAGIIVHEDYDSVSVANDIAMIILSEDIGLAGTDKISAITLPETADRDTLYADGAAVTVIGWGTTEDGGTSDYLRKLSYTITPKASCKEHYGESILDGMMCTGTQPQKNRADTGDSGGPLFTKKNDKWVQIALVSWGPTAADMTDTSYDVNADVLYYKDWITTHKDSAFTEYVTTLSATSSTKAVVLENLRNYLYKTIKITPATAGKYTKITIKSGTMKPYDYLMIYNGDNPLTNTMLAQLTGTLEEQSYTSTTTKGLTLAIMTGKEGKSDGFTFEYSEVSEVGTKTDLTCTSGYTACKDNFFCLNNQLFCEGEGQCIDGSDEVKANCDAVKNNTDGNNGGDGNGDIAKPTNQTLVLLLVYLMVGFLL